MFHLEGVKLALLRRVGLHLGSRHRPHILPMTRTVLLSPLFGLFRLFRLFVAAFPCLITASLVVCQVVTRVPEKRRGEEKRRDKELICFIVREHR